MFQHSLRRDPIDTAEAARGLSQKQDGKMSASIKKFSMASNINWGKEGARGSVGGGGRFVCFLLYAAPLQLTHIHKTTHTHSDEERERARSIYLLKFYVHSQEVRISGEA